jgi:hypothetical protein
VIRFLRTRWLLIGLVLGVLVGPATGQQQCPDPQLYALLPSDYPCPLIRICSTAQGICLIPFTVAPGTPCQCQAADGTWVQGLCVR